MSLMTPDERQRLVPKGLYVKNKCDRCGKPIMSALVFLGPQGGEYCSKGCRDGAPSNEDTVEPVGRSKEKKAMAKENTDKLSKKSKPVPSKNKAARPGSSNKVLPLKKKRIVEDDEEDVPRKKKRIVEEDVPKKKKRVVEDEPAPKKAKASSATADTSGPKKNPYSRPNSIVYKVYDMARAGTTLKAIRAELKSAGVAEARVMRELRSGEFKGFRWKYTETEDGSVSVRPIKAKE